MDAQQDPVYGAANTILQSPLDPNTYWVAESSGGIWKTTDGGHNWTPTTDHQATLQFGAIALDAHDQSGTTLYAGTGDYSALAYTIGPATTIYKSTDGGATWNPISSTWTGLPGQGLQNLYLGFDGTQFVDPTPPAVKGMFAMDNVLVVAMGDSQGAGGGSFNSGAMYRSIDFGAHFSLVPEFTTEVSSFVTTTINNKPVLLAARNGDFDVTADAVFASADEGATWQSLLDSTSTITNSHSANPGKEGFIFPSTGPIPPTLVNNLNIKVAAGPDTSLFVAVVKDIQPFEEMDLLYTPQFTPGSATQPDWLNLGEPLFITPSGDCSPSCTLEGNPQGQLHFALVADPNQKGVAYIAGSGLFDLSLPGLAPDNELATIIRVNYDPVSDVATYTPIVFPDASQASPHPDTRALVFDSNGNLFVAGDGGVYVRTNPEGAGTWSGFGGDAGTGNTISGIEAFAAVMDPVTGRLAFAAQDNGAGLSQPSLSDPWRNVLEGDGFSVALAQPASGPSIFYATNDSESLARILATDNLAPATPPTLLTIRVLTPACHTNVDTCPNYFNYKVVTDFPNGIVAAVNQEDPTKLLFRSNRLFTWTDPGGTIAGDSIGLTDISARQLFDPSTGWSEKLAYGTQDAPDAILAGGPLPSNLVGHGAFGVYLRTEEDFNANPLIGAGNLLTGYQNLNGGQPGDPLDAIFDPATEKKFFIADTFNVYETQDTGNTLTTLALPGTLSNPTSLSYIADQAGDANNGVRALLVGGSMNVAGAQGGIFATLDPFAQTVQWMNLGAALPNADVQDLQYYPAIDTLVAALYGRGVWTLYDVTSNFASANELWFGKANNDSAPDVALLTGNRPLHKFGTGTLTLTGAATYTGGTIIDNGVVAITSDSNLGAVQGGITFNGGTLQINNALSSARAVTLNATGTFDIEADTQWSGTIGGSGELQKIGSATLSLTGVNSYQGGTAVLGGTLAIGADSALGAPSGELGIDNATVRATASFATARMVAIGVDGGAVDTQGFALSGSGLWAALGPFSKLGSGRLVLSGFGLFQGVQVAAGTLQADGALTATTLSVAQGATLSGSGTISAATIVSGRVSPGGDGVLGTLTINGPLTLGAGSTTSVDVGTLSDLLKVNGVATLGGTLVVNPLVTIEQTSSFTILSANAISGAYGAVPDTIPGVLFPVVNQVGATEVVSFNAGSFVTLLNGTGTPDETQIAAGLDAARGAHYFDLAPLYQAIDPLSGAPLNQALENLVPDTERTAPLIGGMVANAVDNMILEHMGKTGPGTETAGLTVDGAGIRAALNNAHPSSHQSMQFLSFGEVIASNTQGGYQGIPTDSPADVALPHPAQGMWLPGGASGFVSGSALHGSVGVGGAGGRADVRGLIIGGGLDLPVGDGFTAGAALAYADTSAVLRASPNTLQSDSIQGGAYVRYDWDNWNAQAFGVYGHQTMTSRRTVTVGPTTFALTGHTGGDAPSVGAYVGRSYHLDSGNGTSLSLTPEASLVYLDSEIDPFTETGGAPALTFAGYSESSVTGRLGIDAEISFHLGGVRLIPNVRLAWADAFSGNNGSIQAAFAAAPGSIMTFPLVASDRSYGEMDLGLDADIGALLGTNATLSGRYFANNRSDVQYGAWTGSLTIDF
jgi:autotransporter-associated beta strand protein